MPILNNKEYQCDFCSGIFGLIRDENWSTEKVLEEYRKTFPNAKMENMEVVCDDCWEKVKPKF